LAKRPITIDEPVDCPGYEKFSSAGDTDSLSIILVSGFLGNPASYYGHLLLRLDSSKQATTDLEGISINFGANIPPDENMIVYIIKGIFGGYNSSFTQQEFFYHNQIYSENQYRDMWVYQLNLTQKQIDLLVGHVWELLGKDYTYYFSNRICGYRLGELLQIVLDPEVVNSIRPWETPQAIVQRLSNHELGGQPLVKKTQYVPSRQSRLYQRFALLNPTEKSFVKETSQDINAMDAGLDKFPLDSKYNILDTLIDYYQFLSDDYKPDPVIKQAYNQTLGHRYQLPARDNNVRFRSGNHPHLGHSPSYLNVGFNLNDAIGNYTNFRLRPAYYDSLDASYGHIKNSSLSMGEINIGVNDSKVWINSFDLLKINNQSKNLTGLPGDRSFSWYIDVGAQQISMERNDKLVPKGNAGIGYAITLLTDNLVLAAYGGGGYNGPFLDTNPIYVSATSTINWSLSEKITFRAEAEHRDFLYTSWEKQIYTIETRAILSPQNDIRIHYSKDKVDQFGISIGLYW
jgi:hypothetical protein